MAKHSALAGTNLHIARAANGTGDPTGVVTPTIVGEFFLDTAAGNLYVADGLTNMDWLLVTTPTGDVSALFVDEAENSTGSTTPVSLTSYTLPAGGLANDGDRLTIEAWGRTGAVAGAHAINLDVGGVSVIGQNPIASYQWHLRYDFVRRDANNQTTQGWYVAGLSLTSAPVVVHDIEETVRTYNLAAPLLFDLQGAAPATGTQTANFFSVIQILAP